MSDFSPPDRGGHPNRRIGSLRNTYQQGYSYTMKWEGGAPGGAQHITSAPLSPQSQPLNARGARGSETPVKSSVVGRIAPSGSRWEGTVGDPHGLQDTHQSSNMKPINFNVRTEHRAKVVAESLSMMPMRERKQRAVGFRAMNARRTGEMQPGSPYVPASSYFEGQKAKQLRKKGL